MASDSSLRPFVIGIAGPSGCGKSSLATSLCEAFDGFVLHEDPKYFKAPAAPSYKDRDPSSETPAFVDWDAYLNNLEHVIHRAFTNSWSDTMPSSAAVPVSRRQKVIVVEHFLLLHDERVVKELDALLFLEPFGDDKEAMRLCMKRRVNRRSNRSAKEVEHLRNYYQQHVWPCFRKYCQSQARAFCEQHLSEGSHPKAIRIDCRLPEADIVSQVRLHVEEWMRRPMSCSLHAGR